MRELVVESLLMNMFGDGLEREYVEQGITFKGVDNMTDGELLKELEEARPEDDDETDMRLICDCPECRAELYV